MGLLDQAKDFVQSSEGKSYLEKGREKLSGQSDTDRNRANNNDLEGNYNTSGSRYSKTDDYNKLGDNDYGSGNYNNENTGSGFQGRDSTRASQAASFGDSGNLLDQSRGGGYGSTGFSDNAQSATDDLGARGGVNSRGVGDNQGSVGSGGYGTNQQGDSYSRRNQSGFDNEFQGNTGY